MEEFVSINDVLRLFREFCSKEISACGSADNECEDCAFYKKWIQFVNENK